MITSKETNGLRLLTYGIYFLGCRAGDSVNGMIASWVMQVSFQPRLIAVGVKKERRSHDLIRDGGVFSLCVLDKNQSGQMGLFKGEKRIDDKTIEGVPYEKLKTGAPVLKECVGFVECKLVQSVETGDHTVFVGEVINEGVRGGDPLTTWDLAGHYYGG
ncbi:MAG: flavin reductase family protein [bacterium]|nr:flavin reductase family protein [bacterium]